MQHRTLSFALCLGVIGCSAQRQPPRATVETTAAGSVSLAGNTVAVKQQIEAANARFLAAIQKGDSAGAAVNYADDAIVMMPNDKAWVGRAAIAKGFADFMSQLSIKMGNQGTDDVVTSGDLAVETGHFDWTLQPKKGKTIHDIGKYLTIWKRQPDGSYKIIRDINNSDLPAK